MPQSKKSSKPTVGLIWTLLIVLVLMAPVAFLRSNTALNNTNEIENAVASLSDPSNVEQDAYTSKELEVFAGRVVDRFIGIPADQEERSEALEQLDNYFATNVPLPEWGDFNGQRTLNSKQLYNIDLEGDRAVLQYRVNYTSVNITETEETEVRTEENDDGDEEEIEETVTVEEEETNNNQALLSIPVTAVEDGYMVIDNPYFSSIPELTGSGAIKQENPLENEEELQMGEREPYESFLSEFFEAYASNEQSEMNYLMDEPASLNGMFEFQSIQQAQIYNIDGRIVALATVEFNESGINATTEEDFTVVIREDQNRYFVEELHLSLIHI